MMDRYFPSSVKKDKGRVESKLEEIVLNEVMFDGVPLPKVLQFLDDESRKRDPEKQGINFLINPNAPAITSTQIDPTTGLATPPQGAEPLDMDTVIVRFNLPLRNVRLRDVLDAIAKVADKPLEYSVEEYGVIFSQYSNRSGGGGLMPAAGTSEPLQVRTFKVDTNTFRTGLNRVFGVGFEPKENATADQTRSALRNFFSKLGINMDVTGKTVFYNELTGIVMVRATFEDLEILKAAIETLGGVANDQVPQAGRGGGSAASSAADAMRALYGMEFPVGSDSVKK
jgi:hypothetical protein